MNQKDLFSPTYLMSSPVLSCPVLSCGPIALQSLSLLGGGDLEQPSSHLHNARAGLGKLSGT